MFDKDQTMQRKLSWTRVRKEMVPYLQNDDAFYSSLTLFMVPRDFEPLDEGEGYVFGALDGNGGDIGRLTVKSTLVLFPADGQHRVASIKEALKENPKMASVNVPVVLIPYNTRGKVRQLFSDLNLNAKPVSKSVGLSFETRDPVAVITKALEDRIGLFTGRLNHMSNSLPATSGNVATINTVYLGTKEILEALGVELEELWGHKPTDSGMKSAIDQTEKVWSVIVDALQPWVEVQRGTMTPGDVRELYVFAHGIGLQALAHPAAVMVAELGTAWAGRYTSVCQSIDWAKTNGDWDGVCMIGERMNNTGAGVRATAGYILKKAGVTDGQATSYIQQYHKSVAENTEADAA